MATKTKTKTTSTTKVAVALLLTGAIIAAAAAGFVGIRKKRMQRSKIPSLIPAEKQLKGRQFRGRRTVKSQGYVPGYVPGGGTPGYVPGGGTPGYVPGGTGAQKPDLIVSNITGSVGSVVTAEIRNIGTANAASGAHLYFYFDGNLKWTYNTNTLYSQDFRQVGGVTLVSPEVINAPTHVRVCIDPHNRIDELNENNNCREYNITGY